MSHPGPSYNPGFLMKTVAIAAFSFAVFRTLPGLLLSLTLFSQASSRPDPIGDFLVAAYLAASSTLLSTAGFVIPTALSSTWRRLRVSRAVIIAGILGLIGPAATLLVTAVDAPLLLPLFRSALWMATALFHGIPGVVLGLVAVLIATVTGRKKEGRVSP
jgi:hypothetical protein